MKDQLKTTSRSWWTRVLTTWVATTLWAILFYTAVLVLLVGITESQGAWGDPVPWPVLVSVLTIPTLCALGFAFGYHFPNRYTAPLVAICVFILFFVGITLAQLGHQIGYLVPVYPSITPSDSVWYEDRPDLGLVQAILLLGLTCVSLASLGAGAARRDSSHSNRWPMLAGGIGVALSVASVSLISGSRVVDGMVRVPAFGGPVTNVSIRYTPVCSAVPLRVCVHPAYRSELKETAALINRIAGPIVGLPGAPTLTTQRASAWGLVSHGGQRMLMFAPIDLHDSTAPVAFLESWEDQLAVSLVSDSHLSTTGLLVLNPAQNALALYLLRRAGSHADPTEISMRASVTAAEQRFADLSPSRHRQWLRTHYDQLRHGRITLGELP